MSDVPHYLGCLDLLPHTSWSHGHSCRMHSIIYTVSTGSFLTPGFGGSRVRSCILRSTFEAAPLLEFTYFAFTRTQGGVTVDESGLCCCVPCLSSAIISLGLLIHSSQSLKKQMNTPVSSALECTAFCWGRTPQPWPGWGGGRGEGGRGSRDA